MGIIKEISAISLRIIRVYKKNIIYEYNYNYTHY